MQSQRPWHAGSSSNRLPQVLPQYLDERIAAEQQASPANQGDSVNQMGSASQTGATSQSGQETQAVGTNLLGNRIGSDTVMTASTPAPSTTTIIPLDLPVDAHGDIDLVNRIKTWPRDKQPFWYINWQAIQAHRGDANNNAQPAQIQPNPTSFFAG